MGTLNSVLSKKNSHIELTKYKISDNSIMKSPRLKESQLFKPRLRKEERRVVLDNSFSRRRELESKILDIRERKTKREGSSRSHSNNKQNDVCDLLKKGDAFNKSIIFKRFSLNQNNS
jgi:hypothetical protein